MTEKELEVRLEKYYNKDVEIPESFSNAIMTAFSCPRRKKKKEKRKK